MPSLAEGAGEAAGARPAYEYSAPLAVEGERVGADNPAPGKQQTPPPAPDGCPFRDGKLELIV